MLKKFTPDSNNPNFVAIYDIDAAQGREIVNSFSGVVVDTNTGQVTHLLTRTTKNKGKAKLLLQLWRIADLNHIPSALAQGNALFLDGCFRQK